MVKYKSIVREDLLREIYFTVGFKNILKNINSAVLNDEVKDLRDKFKQLYEQAFKDSINYTNVELGKVILDIANKSLTEFNKRMKNRSLDSAVDF